MVIKAILFDKDGTLIDVNRTWIPIYRDMLRAEFGLDDEGVDAKLEAAGYDRSRDVFRSGSVLAGGTTQQLVQIWWPELSPTAQRAQAQHIDTTYAPLARTYLRPLFDLAPVLDALRAQGFILGVGTNDSAASATSQMTHLGIADRFTAILGCDSVEQPKPSGQMVQLFASMLGVAVNDVAMVGDNVHDLEEAHRGGAGLAVGVLTGNGTRGDLAPLAHHVVASVADLPELLRQV